MHGAHVDLRPGGVYRIANRLPNGTTLWISGEFESIDPPTRLVYTWRTDPAGAPERVTVSFESRGEFTDVTVVHERIADDTLRRGHESGWLGCLNGLESYLAPLD